MMDCSASSHGYTHCSPEDQIPIIHLLCSWTGHTNDAWYTYAGGRVCCEVEQPQCRYISNTIEIVRVAIISHKIVLIMTISNQTNIIIMNELFHCILCPENSY